MRSSEVVTGWQTWAIVMLFLAGVLTLGIGADYLASERTDRIAIAKACAEAQKAIAEQDLSAPNLLLADLSASAVCTGHSEA